MYLCKKGKINQCIDKCVHILKKITKDKTFERLIKLEKGKTSYQIGIINNRHAHSIKLSIQAITETQYNEWTVTSTSKPDIIKKQQKNCQNFVYNARNAMFVYTSIDVHLLTVFSM